jgi:lipoprotein-anchoring transpeptidase ErfK/SrfK
MKLRKITLFAVLLNLSAMAFSTKSVSDLIKNPNKAIFLNQKISIPKQDEELSETAILGLQSEKSNLKTIFIDLAKQRLYAIEDGKLIYTFLVSTGKWGRTPTGKFKIWTKFRFTLMQGGSQELRTYYYLPNVPYTMFFYNNEIPQTRGYGIHGTYWHDNFGHTMSHGCVNMKTEEVEKLYYWTNPIVDFDESKAATHDDPGTTIVIYGEAPKE